MFIAVRKWTILYVLTLVILVLGFAAIMVRGESVQTLAQTDLYKELPMLIIDPGHGGEDGGAVAGDGTVESQINLMIGIKTHELSKLLGWKVCMTRSEDISIHDPEATTLRQKKVSDLKNRAKLCNEQGNCILISIHQNSMPTAPSVRGAQVFYNGQEASAELAQIIQSKMNAYVNGGKGKESKLYTDSYLMKNAKCPAILLECGFLSNSDELSLLKDEVYQTKLTMCIISALAQYFEIEQNISG